MYYINIFLIEWKEDKNIVFFGYIIYIIDIFNLIICYIFYEYGLTTYDYIRLKI